MVTFVSMLALGVEFLIFVYLYSSHRVRFFRYLLWAWGFLTTSKALKLVGVVLPSIDIDGLMNVAAMEAQLCLLAAGLAYRWDYRIRRRGYITAGIVALVALALGSETQEPTPIGLAASVVLGSTQILAGLAFWPQRSSVGGYRGGRFLATSLVLWGTYWIASQFIVSEPGSLVYVARHATYVFFYFISTFAIIIMVLDRARTEMRSLKELNERLVNGLREGLELVDGDYTIRHGNRWMEEQFGPVVGRRCYEVLTADGRRCPGCPMERWQSGEAAAAAVTPGLTCHGPDDAATRVDGPVRLEVDGVDGRRFLLSCSPVRQPSGEVFMLELVADVTELERLRARLREAERLAATGEMAAGMAHEIRNPLAAIVNATTLLADAEALTAEERASTLGAMRKEARRLNRILSDFLSFARPREPRRQVGDVAEVVARVASLLRDDPARAGEVQLEVRVDPDVPAIAFDPDQITQVLWNVALNAVEAMDGQGRLAIEVARDNGHVAIAVTDTGPGIPPEERSRVLEPFYSKKPGGTGLGLTIAQRVVTAHGGRLDLASEPGAGTRVTINLPIGGA
jgi:signal transduction histidine kinase